MDGHALDLARAAREQTVSLVLCALLVCCLLYTSGVTIHNTNDLQNVEEDAEQYTRAPWPNANMNDARVQDVYKRQGRSCTK